MKQVFKNVFHYEDIARSKIKSIIFDALFADKGNNTACVAQIQNYIFITGMK